MEVTLINFGAFKRKNIKEGGNSGKKKLFNVRKNGSNRIMGKKTKFATCMYKNVHINLSKNKTEKLFRYMCFRLETEIIIKLKLRCQ